MVIRVMRMLRKDDGGGEADPVAILEGIWPHPVMGVLYHSPAALADVVADLNE